MRRDRDNACMYTGEWGGATLPGDVAVAFPGTACLCKRFLALCKSRPYAQGRHTSLICTFLLLMLLEAEGTSARTTDF